MLPPLRSAYEVAAAQAQPSAQAPLPQEPLPQEPVAQAPTEAPTLSPNDAQIEALRARRPDLSESEISIMAAGMDDTETDSATRAMSDIQSIETELGPAAAAAIDAGAIAAQADATAKQDAEVASVAAAANADAAADAAATTGGGWVDDTADATETAATAAASGATALQMALRAKESGQRIDTQASIVDTLGLGAPVPAVVTQDQDEFAAAFEEDEPVDPGGAVPEDPENDETGEDAQARSAMLFRVSFLVECSDK